MDTDNATITTIVIISPILAVLFFAWVQHIFRNPPRIAITAYNAMCRAQKNALYIQSLELENARLRKALGKKMEKAAQEQAEEIEYYEEPEQIGYDGRAEDDGEGWTYYEYAK